MKKLFTILFITLFSSVFSQGVVNDSTFNPEDGFNNSVETLALQPDGKIIVGGYFNSFNGTNRNRIARLNADGSLDTTFNPGTGFKHKAVYCVAIQSDGKIIVGGNFISFNGISRENIARLNADGSLDTSFDPGTGFHMSVYCLALQSDGKILVGGEFNSFNGVLRNHIARLNGDGSLDFTFYPGTGFRPYLSGVLSIALQSDGKILAGGTFISFNGTSRNGIARLNKDGSLDTSFNPKTGFDDGVSCVTLQPDGKILVGGYFSSFNGTSRNGIARLNEDGSLDTSFNSSTGFDGDVSSIALQPDGKILVGGLFSSFNSISTNSIAQLNVDGSLDTFGYLRDGLRHVIQCMSFQPDGKIIIGGVLDVATGKAKNYISRLITSGTDTLTACDSLTWIDGNTYTSSNTSATHTVTNDIGYDSLVFLNLTIASNTGTDFISTCDRLTWLDRNTYTSSNNTATQTLTNAAGCDSVVTLNLTITNSTAGTDIITICDSLTWIDGNTYTSSNDTATYVLTNAAGCDSVVTLNLIVNNLSDSSTTITLNDKTITANNTNATYQWVDCDNEHVTIPEETSQHFTATNKGNYAVEITENGCVDTSACVQVIPEIPCDPLEIGFYPNPANDIITFQVSCSIPSLKVDLFNGLGQWLSTHQLQGTLPSLQLPENSGLYLIEVSWGEKRQIHKVVRY